MKINSVRLLGMAIASAIGAAIFAVIQTNLLDPITPGKENMGWFLNSGRNLLTIESVLVCTAAVITILSRSLPAIIQNAIALAIGAIAAMIVILFKMGPGNLFPIVIFMAGVLLNVAVLVGTCGGLLIRKFLGKQ